METYVISAVFLDYENVAKDQIQTLDTKYLIREIKILLLSPNFIIPSFQLPMIRLFIKQNKVQCIKEDIRKILGVKSKTMLNVREVNFSDDSRFHDLKLPVAFVFLNSMECERHLAENSLKTKFVPISELNHIAIGEQSMDYICAIQKWIRSESANPLSLIELFRRCKRSDAHLDKSKVKRTQSGKPSDRAAYKHEPDVLHKSTSLDVIARPELVDINSCSRKHTESLDRISRKQTSSTPPERKNSIRSKVAVLDVTHKPRPGSVAPPRNQSIKNEVITNPLLTNHLDFSWSSDIVVINPFWNLHRPDLSHIRTPSKMLFIKEHSVYRTRSWSLDYPLHFAAYKGDMLLVSPLVGKGYSCMERDYAGWTPLHYAVWYGHEDVVAMFLQSHLVSVNCCTEDSLSPLHLALVNRQSAITNLLLRQSDVDTSLKNNVGEEARSLAEKYDKQFLLPLIRHVPARLSRIPVHLMDNSLRSLILSHGVDTTFQQLRVQMIDILNIPNSCIDVFSFWVSYRTLIFSGKNAVIPVECFGPLSMPLRDLALIDFRLLWKRNVFLDPETERKVKHPLVISLLFAEAELNFTRKSHYPCDPKDISLLSSVLLYLHLPSSVQNTNKTQSRRAFSLNRVNRPLSFVLGSKLNVQARQMSASVQTLKDRPNYHFNASSFNDLSEKSTAMEQRNRQVKTFLSSYKNISLIMPKKALKNSKLNWAEEIIDKFLQSPYSYQVHSTQDSEFRFLTLCWNLTLYGCAYFHVEIKLTTSIPFSNFILAVNDMGVYFLHSRTKSLIQNFKYSSITWHSSTADRCLVLFTKKNNIYIKTKQSAMISQLMLKLHSINL